MPEGFMLYFRIDKANSLMDRFKFMGLEAAECFRAIGSSSATVPSCPCDCSAGRQEHFVPFWPCGTMINQKKLHKIPIGSVLFLLGTSSVRLLEVMCHVWPQQVCESRACVG